MRGRRARREHSTSPGSRLEKRKGMFHVFVRFITDVCHLVLEIRNFVIKLRSMTSPTKRLGASRRRATKKLPSYRSIARRRVKPKPPEIFVRSLGLWGMQDYARAHLRNKDGYLYLSWRDGKKIRTHYLGKAPQSSPTPAARS